jgi:hypothetical protein
MTSTDYMAGGSITFEAPIVDYVKFAGQFWVYLANGKTYVSSDGMRFDEATIIIQRGKPVA